MVRSRPGPRRIFDFVEGLLFDVEPRARAAALAVVEEDGAGHARNRRGDVGILEDDIGRLAAELERHLLQVASGRLHDELTDFGRAGERDFVHVGVRRERRAGRFTVAGNDVDDAVGNAGFLNQFAEAQRAERSLLGGLEHDRAARGERGAEFPRRHHQREVPRDNLADDADRLAQRVRKILRAVRGDGDGVAFDLGGPAGHVAEHVHGAGHVGDARDGEGLAIVERFELREFVGVLFDEVGELPDEPAAFGGSHLRPRAAIEGRAGGVDGAIDVLFLAFGDASEDVAGGGIVAVERFAGRGVHPLAVDQHFAWLSDEAGYVVIQLNCLSSGGHLFPPFV